MNLLLMEDMINYVEQHLISKEEQSIYEIITGGIKHPAKPYEQYDLEPDLILKMNFPSKDYIPHQDKPDLTEFTSNDLQKITRTYSRAEKMIHREMHSAGEIDYEANYTIRMQKSIEKTTTEFRTCEIAELYEDELTVQSEPLEIACTHRREKVLDLFTIQLNTIIYILQRICGFRLRTFLLESHSHNKSFVLIFLTLSEDNLTKVADRYRIKKEVYSSYLDFYVNDPVDSLGRPLKFHSSLQNSTNHNKIIGRSFKSNVNLSKISTSVRDEDELNYKIYDSFIECNQADFMIYKFLKHPANIEISSKEKVYLHRYTKNKSLNGCLSVFYLHKQREAYFYLSKSMHEVYNYRTHKDLRSYKQFFMLNKETKGVTFRRKMEALISYVPQVVNQYGDLDLFSKMERTKLCYLAIKEKFKVDFMRKFGYEFLALGSNFEKFEDSLYEEDSHHLNLVESWPFHSFSSNIHSIRNYFGNNVGFEILTAISLIQFFASMSLLYIFIDVIEEVNENIFITTRYISSALFVIGFQVFFVFWREAEEEFVSGFSDARDSKIFLKEYRGPFVRNIITDEPNEYTNTTSNFLANTIVSVIAGVCLSIIGMIFYAARALLLQLYGDYGASMFSIFSVEHIFAYCIYFAALMVLQSVANKPVISLFIKILNPSTDEHERKLVKMLMFHYLLAIEMIGPLFFLIIEPLNDTSCYSSSCYEEFSHYVSTRYLFITVLNFGDIIFMAAQMNFLKWVRSDQIPHGNDFHSRLAGLLEQALGEAEMEEYEVNHAHSVIYLVTCAMYCTIVTNSIVYSFIGMFVSHFSTRLKLLYSKRRPIDKSELILQFSEELKTMYYIGVVFNSWIVIFSFEFVEWYGGFLIINLQSTTPTSMLMLKFLVAGLYSVGLLLLGEFVKALIGTFRGESAVKRRNKKLKEFEFNQSELRIYHKKIEELIPVKTIFRVFNTDDIVRKLILEYILERQVDLEKFQGLQSHNHLERENE